jgi:hypothetical protein
MSPLSSVSLRVKPECLFILFLAITESLLTKFMDILGPSFYV